MTVSASPAPFPIEGVLKETLELFRKEIGTFIVVLLIGGAPSFLGRVLVETGGHSMVTIAVLLGLVGGVTSALASATVQASLLTGTTDLNAAMASVAPRLLPLLGLLFVAGVAIAIGIVLLIVPGIVLACAFCVGVPVFLDQNTGAIESLQRSYQLTKGNWLRIFVMLLICGIAVAIIGIIAGLVLQLILGGIGAALASWLVGAGIGAFVAILTVVTYRELKAGVARSYT